MPRGAEGPRDAIWCRETARSYGVQRDRATLQRTEKPRDATSCRGTARHCVVQRDRAMPRGAERPRDATALQISRAILETARRRAERQSDVPF